jgi:hypothetical protein
MVIVRLMGGLGNQLFQYAAGRALAHRHGVALKLDLASFATNPLRRYALGAFDIAAAIATAEEAARLYSPSLAGRVRRRLERLLPTHRRRYYLEPRARRHMGPVPLGSDVYLHGYWQTEKHFEPIAPLLRRELTLRHREAFEQRPLVRAVEGDDSVSVHVRRGDYVGTPRSAALHGTCPAEYYRAALDAVEARVPRPRLFVFSDDPGRARAELDLGHPATHVSGGGLSDAEELVLMSRCRHHVIANSSFSWWGAWLDARPGGIVVAPRRWFADPSRQPHDLLPPAWLER